MRLGPPAAEYYLFGENLATKGKVKRIKQQGNKNEEAIFVRYLSDLLNTPGRTLAMNNAFIKSLAEIKLSSGCTILHIAARSIDFKLLEVLFFEGSALDINQKDQEGLTLLDHAMTVKGSANLVSFLRRKNAKTKREIEQDLAQNLEQKPALAIEKKSSPLLVEKDSPKPLYLYVRRSRHHPLRNKI